MTESVRERASSTELHRVLPEQPFTSLADYENAGGGAGLRAARHVEATVVIDELIASGLRGRGGAGFPTGIKWRTILANASPILASSVVVNAAEGEPGTFKDRTIIRRNPYAVLEGALIAAHVVDARSIVVATKASFGPEIARIASAIAELDEAGWTAGVDIRVVQGPAEYLFGEETALLEVLDGRPPFPRIAPPYRRGVVEVVRTDRDADSGSGLSADVHMAGPEGTSPAPPVLVDNVETMANVAAIVARGATWFREIGTADSPGTIVCTVTGAVRHAGVAEIPMGTTLRSAIEIVGGGVPEGDHVGAVLVGVSSAPISADQLDVPLTYEAMAAIGSGLGSAGFIVIGVDDDPVAVAAGVSRFLAISSCGQCTPCKQDGLEIAARLAALAGGNGSAADVAEIETRLGTIADGARCSLAVQHQTVVSALLRTFDGAVAAHLVAGSDPVPVHLVAELVDIDDGSAVFDASFADRQPDWTVGGTDSGKTPVERFTDHRAAPPPTT